MWTYQQASGAVTNPEGDTVGAGYSGQPPYTNDTTAECLPNKGPIPRGAWTMAQLIAEDPERGPDVIVLAPGAYTRAQILTSARDPNSFRIHGERIAPPPGYASDGCIILDRPLRLQMWQSEDHQLQVI